MKLILTLLLIIFLAWFIIHDDKLEKPIIPQNPIISTSKGALIEDIPDSSEPLLSRVKESSSESLLGPIHNQYGIRDDIFNYIETTIPKYNIMGWKAAIEIAKNENLLYHAAQTDDEAIKASNEIYFQIQCLHRAYPEGHQYYDIFKTIEDMMQNTPERKKHFWDIIEKHFGNQYYPTPEYTEEELKSKCELGI